MKIIKSQLKILIENFLSEDAEWLSDDEDDLNLEPGLEEKVNKAFELSKNKIILELKSSNTDNQNISQDIISSAIKIINKTHLHTTDVIDIKFKGIKALAFHASYGDDSGEDRDVLHYSKIPKGINVPESILSSMTSDPLNNPLIIVFNLYAQKSSESALSSLLLHEVGHIKNSVIKALSDKAGIGPQASFNVDQVKAALRKDLVKGNKRQIAEYIIFHDKPKRIGDSKSEKALVLRLSMYYQGLYEEPADDLGVEELAVRLSALKRNSGALEDFKAGERDYQYFANKYNTDVADIMLFVDEGTTLEAIDKIVSLDKESKKSVTV